MATCKECVHNNICNIKQKYNHPKYALQHIEKYCEHFKDRSRFVELPCKVGDTVYRPRYSQLSEQWEIDEWVVTEISFVNYHVGYLFDKNGNQAVGNKENRIKIHLALSDNSKLYKEALVKPICVPLADLDDLFFITYEEAEQALKEREINEN